MGHSEKIAEIVMGTIFALLSLLIILGLSWKKRTTKRQAIILYFVALMSFLMGFFCVVLFIPLCGNLLHILILKEVRGTVGLEKIVGIIAGAIVLLGFATLSFISSFLCIVAGVKGIWSDNITRDTVRYLKKWIINRKHRR